MKKYLRVFAIIVGICIFQGCAFVFADADESKDVYGDIKVQRQGESTFDTTHEKLYEVKPGEVINYTTTLDGSVVKEQIEAEKAKYNSPFMSRFITDKVFGDRIRLSDTEVKFVTLIKPAEGLEFPDPSTDEGRAKYTMTPQPFFIDNITKNSDGTISVNMVLDTKDIHTFADLYKVVVTDKAVDCLVLNVQGVKVPDDAEENHIYSSEGEIWGSFHSKASVAFISQNYDYKWRAVQDTDIPGTGEDGTDITLKDASDTSIIRASVIVKKAEEPIPPDEPENSTPDESEKDKPSPSNEEKGKSVEKETSGNPQTGDGASVELYVIITIISALSLLSIRIKSNDK